ncbi:hypothetical protein PLICRDRAFT_538378 [Plicaturopsis crispa FD-325 SS-3]|nr:hypothetical protein PLICRDRAFT_538378 [Plicaturopsis crispa FD-325 SS-3]
MTLSVMITTASHPSHSSTECKASKIPVLSPTLRDARDIVKSLLTRCDIPYVPHVPYDHALEAAVLAEGARRGYCLSGPHSIERHIPVGVTLGSTSFGHLSSQSTRVHVCLYSAIALYIDDVFDKYIDIMVGFNERFCAGLPQGDKVLDDFADALRRTPQYFGRLQGNMIVNSFLNFMVGCMLEHEMQGMPLSPSSAGHNYAGWARSLCGGVESLAFAIFPPELLLQSYIQTISDIDIFLNAGNDILSFYKEELVGEEVNHVSLIAKSRNISKSEVLRMLEDQVVTAHHNVVQTLAPHKEALDAYKRFSEGYVAFHSSSKRYHLDALDL